MPKSQIDLLAEYIMAEIPGEPSRSEGAGETAIRIIKRYRDFAILARRIYDSGCAFCGDKPPTALVWQRVGHIFDLLKKAEDGGA